MDNISLKFKNYSVFHYRLFVFGIMAITSRPTGCGPVAITTISDKNSVNQFLSVSVIIEGTFENWFQ